MLAPEAIRLAEETVRDLRAHGQPERAAVVEMLLAVAISAGGDQAGPSAAEYWTIRQAARITGQSARFIRKLIVTGKLPAVIHGGYTLVRPAAVWGCLDAVGAGPLPEPLPTEQANEAARRRRAFVESGLPADEWVRLERLHEKMQEGHRLSRAEHSEMVALERVVLSTAGERLEAWTRQTTPASS